MAIFIRGQRTRSRRPRSMAAPRRAWTQDEGVLVIAGAPLREPVVQHGPFVMNKGGEGGRGMKAAVLIARGLGGLVFLFFGLNGFLHFLPQPPMPQPAVTFFGGLAATGYMLPLLFGTQVVGGALLLVGLVPLGVLVLTPVIVNIVAFHVFVVPSGLA